MDGYYPVLVKTLGHLDDESVIHCHNCGGNVSRIEERWVKLKKTFCEDSGLPHIVVGEYTFWCAVCGKEVDYVSLFGEDVLEDEYTYATEEEAKSSVTVEP